MPDNLMTVLTIKEVSRFWGKSVKSVKQAIQTTPGKKAKKAPLVARQTDDGIWLIDLNSVLARWGEMKPQE